MTRAKTKVATEFVTAENLEAGDVIVMPAGGTWTVERVQLGLNIVRVTSKSSPSNTEQTGGIGRPFNVLRTTQFVRQVKA